LVVVDDDDDAGAEATGGEFTGEAVGGVVGFGVDRP
jgi:hypothetical protein